MKPLFAYFTILISILLFNTSNSQSTDLSWKLYDDSQVAIIKITMNPASYTWMMENPHVDSMHVCSVQFKNKYIDTLVTNIGIRLRGNTSRDAKKKSFKLSFNEYVSGRDFYSVEKMNLNGEHNDPSIARTKIAWDIYKKIGIKGSRASYAAVYINNSYHGLYISVEHYDEEFLKKNFADNGGNLWKALYGADLRISDNNYEVEQAQDPDNLKELVRLKTIINTTPSVAFQDSLEKVFSIHEFLTYEALNALIGCWDDYWGNKNNFYLYCEQKSKIFHWLPYDLDNTLGIGWNSTDWAKFDPYAFPKVSSGSRPLIENMLSFTDYKDLYTHLMINIRDNFLQYNQIDPELLKIENLITLYAEMDAWKAKDYGFTNDDFHKSFGAAAYSNQHVKYGIRQYLVERNKYLQNKLNYIGSNPIIYKIEFSPSNPSPTDSIYVYAYAFGSNGLNKLNIQYHPGLLTVIYSYPMKHLPDPKSTSIFEKDKWVAVIPPMGINAFAKFKIEITDNSGVTKIFPRANFINLKTSGTILNPTKVLINEFMADNTKTIADPSNTTKNEYDDWVELYNPSTQDVNLTGLYLTDDPTRLNKWQISQQNINLKPKEHMLVWCDEQGSQTGLHASFKLSKGGEYIAIVESDGKTIIDEYTFGAQQSDISFGRFPSGDSKWGFMTPSPGTANTVTSIEMETIPTEFSVSAYPNPFNPETTIQLTIAHVDNVSIEIFNILGKEIWKKNFNSILPGTYNIKWSGKDNFDNSVSSGIYLCRVKNNNSYKTQKLILMR